VFNLSSFAVYFLQAHLNLPQEQAVGPASRLMLYVGVFIFIFAALSGWLADRFSRRLLIGAAGLLAALGTLVAILSPDLTMLYAGGCLIGAGTGLFYTASWALGTLLVSKAEAGRYLGISNLAGAGAGAVGSYIGGPIADFFTVHVPSVPGLGYVLLFGIYGLLFLFSILAVTWIKEPADAA
jgi:MFS family permease